MKLLIREGRLYLAMLGLAAIILFFVHPVLVMLPVTVFFFLVFFFRDPVRQIPGVIAGETSFLSPADGKVMGISEVMDPYLFKGRARVVTIFLSPLDVHVNRSPSFYEELRTKNEQLTANN